MSDKGRAVDPDPEIAEMLAFYQAAAVRSDAYLSGATGDADRPLASPISPEVSRDRPSAIGVLNTGHSYSYLHGR